MVETVGAVPIRDVLTTLSLPAHPAARLVFLVGIATAGPSGLARRSAELLPILEAPRGITGWECRRVVPHVVLQNKNASEL